ncbi:hypothetical protein BDR26DRAFT_866698 [Obelidium mucronatum]|nr:hypothetical protein BDR26DRAFT_866698 [Obelidium mucronatum]
MSQIMLKRGRKPVVPKEPVSRRAAQLKEAARVHKEKKARELEELNSEIRRLTETVKEVHQLRERVAGLESDLALALALTDGNACHICLETGCHQRASQSGPESIKALSNLLNLSVFPSMAASLPVVSLINIEPRLICSQDIFGPIHIDSLRKGVLDISNFLKPRTVMFKIIQTMPKLMSLCNPLDRSTLLHVLSMSHETNISHIKYVTEFCGSFFPNEARLLSFKAKLQTLESLASNWKTIDELCDSIEDTMTAPLSAMDSFFRIYINHNKLIATASHVDRVLLMELSRVECIIRVVEADLQYSLPCVHLFG